MIEIGIFLVEVTVGYKETIEKVWCDKSGF